MPEQIADVVFVVELRADPQGQALHRQQVLGLRDHDPQVVEFEEGAELPPFAQECFCAIVEPIRRDTRRNRHARGGLTDLAGRAKHAVHVLRGRAGGMSQTHDGPADQEQFPFRTRTAQLSSSFHPHILTLQMHQI